MDKKKTESRKIHSVFCALLFLLAANAASAAMLTVELQDQNGLPVSAAVVSLTRDIDQTSALPPATAIMAQQGQEFVPRVLAIARGGSVQFTNRDDTKHHVYSFSAPKPFEIPLFGRNEKPAVVFDQPGVVTIGCNIHDSMRSFVIVLDTQHFAVSGDDGVAIVDLGDATSGELNIWHERMASPFQPEPLLSAALSEKQVRTLTLKAPPKPLRRGLEAWKNP